MRMYNVYMGQGVSVADLSGLALSTGMSDIDSGGDAGDLLFTCSAIILGNFRTRAAGLYHFPAGRIDEDEHSRSVLQAMRRAITPGYCCVVDGGGELSMHAMGLDAQYAIAKKAKQVKKLEPYIRQELLADPGLYERKVITTGVAWVTWYQSGLDFDVNTRVGQKAPDDTFVDLRRTVQGAYRGFQVYGRPM